MDLAAVVEFDLQAMRANIHAVRPGMEILGIVRKVRVGDGRMDRMP